MTDKNKETDSKEIKEIEKEEEDEEIEETLEEEVTQKEFSEMDEEGSSKILSIARNLAFQPPAEPEQPLESMVGEVPDKPKEDEEKSSRKYFEGGTKNYDSERPGQEEDEEKYQMAGTKVETKTFEERQGERKLPFERDAGIDRANETTFREDYLERRPEDKKDENRKYETKVKVERM